MTYFFIFLVGLAVGSFLNVIVYRETHESKSRVGSWLPPWLLGRSYCDHCRRELHWFDNIPLLSFLFLKGKCRYCRHKIAVEYPLIELLTGLEFVWAYWLLTRLSFFGYVEGFYSFGLSLYWFFLLSASVAIVLVDLKKQVIPDSVLIPMVILSILRLFMTGQWHFLFTAFAAGAFFLGLFLITRGKGIGFGDVKLSFFIGLVLGWWQKALVAFFLAFLTGAVAGVIVVVLGKKTLKSSVPFGPFLLTAMWIAKLWGNLIWEWYWGFLKI